ncbi:MAG: RNA polymerase sigma factor [Patescibacteria group bacterium]
MRDDNELISIYKEGNTEGFKELLEKYTPVVYNFVRRLAGEGNADDLTQETFIKVWKNLGRFDAEKSGFKTWLFTIARNTAYDFLRKKKSFNFSDLENDDSDFNFSDSISDENLLPDEALQKMEDKEFLNKILDHLRADYREVLVLHYQEEMTFDQIGKVLGSPLNTVKSKHYRALIELRKML